MALNTFKCNHPMPLHFKGLIDTSLLRKFKAVLHEAEDSAHS